MGFSDRLGKAMGKIKVREVAELSGLPESTIRSYLASVEPSVANAVVLAKTLNVDIGWLASGEGDMFPGKTGSKAHIKYLRDTCFTSSQREWHKEKSKYFLNVTVSSDWLYDDFGIKDSSNLRWVYVDSDAMGPALRKGNLVMIHLCIPEGCASEGLYAVYMEGGLLFRRVQPGDKGKIIFSPDNPIYQPVTHDAIEIINGEMPENAPPSAVGMIGKVIYNCHRT